MKKGVHRYPTQPLSLQQVREKVEEDTIKVKCGPYNTTGTYEKDHTILDPDEKQILYCVAAVLQAEVVIEEETPLDNVTLFDVECFGEDDPPQVVLNTKADTDDVTKNPYADFEYMARFICLLHKRCRCNPECGIIALVYINRITCKGEFHLTPGNWRNVWVSCVVLAQKMWDDRIFKTADYTDFLSGLRKSDIRDMEREALGLLNFEIGVKASLYAKYYFELRNMYCDFSPEDNNSTVEAVVNVAAPMVEERSHNRRYVKRRSVDSSNKVNSSREHSKKYRKVQ